MSVLVSCLGFLGSSSVLGCGLLKIDCVHIIARLVLVLLFLNNENIAEPPLLWMHGWYLIAISNHVYHVCYFFLFHSTLLYLFCLCDSNPNKVDRILGTVCRWSSMLFVGFSTDWRLVTWVTSEILPFSSLCGNGLWDSKTLDNPSPLVSICAWTESIEVVSSSIRGWSVVWAIEVVRITSRGRGHLKFRLWLYFKFSAPKLHFENQVQFQYLIKYFVKIYLLPKKQKRSFQKIDICMPTCRHSSQRSRTQS